MAFDVYVGTLTRFYRREWENAAQRMAREEGMIYNMIYAGGEPEPPPEAEELREAVQGWCDAMNRGMQPHGIGTIGWDESDERPYFTDRPSWDGYSGLLIWAAHAEHPDLPLPDEVPESWVEDPAFQRSTVREFKSKYRTILEPELWLPTEFPFIFNAPSLVSENACIGSVFTLKQQLDELHSQTATQLQELIAANNISETEPKKSGILGGLFRRKNREPKKQAKPGVAEVVEFGLSVFRELAAKACEHRLPMLLHY